MFMPSIFGESLFDRDPDDWFDFRMPQFPDVDKVLYGRHAKNIMKTDVKELKNGYLTISAEKGLDKEDKNEDKNEDKKYLRKERYEGSMSRSFYVGDEITEKEINASYKNGVLTLELPKKDQKKVEADTSHMIEVH